MTEHDRRHLTSGGGAGPGGRIEPIELQTSMQRAYIDYAMAVIVGRALPDVRDGLKPVHRRVLYAMYDGGYRPDRGFSKCSRVVGDVMGQYHPHGDTAIYDTLVRLAQPWVMRAPLIHGQGNFGSPGNDSAAAMRYTECRMAPLALEMVRDIERGHRRLPAQLRRPLRRSRRCCRRATRTCWSTARPASRSAWPPTSRRTTCARSPTGAQWALEHPDATREELQDALIERIKGPDFPNGALIVGRAGHRAGLPHRPRLGHPARGRSRSTRTAKGRTCLVDHRAALHGQPRQPRAEDRRARRLRQGAGHRRRPRRLLGPHRPAAGRRAQARRGRPGGAQQPAQAHRAADQLQRQHAGPGRRRAAHADRSTSSSATGSPTRSRSSSGAPASGCARPRSGPTSCAAWSRRSTCSTR